MRLMRGCKGAWIALAAVAADRITKALAVRLSPDGAPLIPHVLNASLASNTGMAFSMFTGQTLALSVATIVLVLVLVVWLLARPDAPGCLRMGLWFIVGGGLGNLFDRIVYGYVVEFLELAFVRFAVFNVADICICLGAGLAVLAVIMDEARKGRAHGGRHADY